MKKLFALVSLLAIIVLFAAGCGKNKTTDAQVTPSAGPYVEISVDYNKQDGIATNQYAVWIETGDGDFVKTVFVTHFTASGGWEKRPEALPVWVEKSGLSAGTAQNIDAGSGATPKSGRQTYYWDCTDEKGQAVPAGEYRFIVEGIIFWQDAVLYGGSIRIGGEENSAQAEAQYTTDEAKQSDMITSAGAVYKP
jgi:hypothetical protein